MTLLSRWISLCLAALVGAGCGGGLPPRPGTPPEHLLLVTISGLRADHLSGPYLYLRPTTAWPLETALKNDGQALALDDLSEQGVALAWAFAPSPRSRDSLVAVHTGYPSVVVDAHAELPTLAEALSKVGFDARAFVSSNGLGDTQQLARGFKTFEAHANDAETLDAAAQALAALDRTKTPHVFFWVHLDGPDAPFEPPALPPREGEAGGAIDFARRFVDPNYTGSVDGSLATLERIERGELVLTHEDRDHLVDLYDGEVAATAGLLRNFVAAWRNVDSTGAFFEHTLLVVAGTSGVDLYERARAEARHGAWIGIERVRVPLFFRHPGSMTGSRLFSELVELTDIAPTVREWFLGLGSQDAPSPGSGPRSAASGSQSAASGAPWAASGRTLLPRFDTYVERPFASRSALSLDLEHRAAALRTPEWTLLSVTPAGATVAEYRLYDRVRDPREEQDVATARPDKVAELQVELDRRIAALSAP